MIELKDLSFSYGTKPVLRELSLSFSPARLYAIVGPNGCGKTSLIRVMARLRQAQSGQLLLEGRPYSQYSRKAFARKLALLPQTRPIPAISVRELVAHGRFPYLDLSRRLSREDEEIIDRAMQASGTADFAQRDLRELSGGERQRVYLALLLAQDSPCVLLDEPSTYLDISSQFSVMENLRSMSRGGKCVVAVLHDLSLALSFCDELCVMDGGRILAQGAPGDIVKAGVLDRVFGIRCQALEHEGETDYLFRPQKT